MVGEGGKPILARRGLLLTRLTGARMPLVPLVRNRGFLLLWIGQVLSDTGTEAARIACPLLIPGNGRLG